MKALLICPETQAPLGLLGTASPLSNTPLLGQSLLEYWMAHLAMSGVKEVTVLAGEPCEPVRELVGNGARWGISANVLVKPAQLGAIETLLRDEPAQSQNLPQTTIAVLDHFPSAPEFPLFSSYDGLFKGLMAWMPKACTPDRVDMREAQPGVFVGMHSVVHADAILRAPCWIGSRAHVGAGSIIGPEAIVENGAFVDSKAEVTRGIVRPDTFVGRFAVLSDCIAAGSTLVDLATSVETHVPDPFVLSALRPLGPFNLAGAWAGKLANLYARHKLDVLWAWRHLAIRKEG